MSFVALGGLALAAAAHTPTLSPTPATGVPVLGTPFAADQLPDSEIDRLAHAVLLGRYGNGEQRQMLLGNRYAVVQSRVNELIAGGRATPAAAAPRVTNRVVSARPGISPAAPVTAPAPAPGPAVATAPQPATARTSAATPAATPPAARPRPTVPVTGQGALPMPTGGKIVRNAMSQLGTNQDCTALVRRALLMSGLNYQVGTLFSGLPPVGFRVSEPQPGDIIYYTGDRHMAVYIGGGQAVHGGYWTSGGQTTKVGPVSISRGATYYRVV